MPQPIVAVSTDIRQFENYTWHAAPQQYLEAALTAAGVLPLMVPSFGDRLDLDSLLHGVDGVLVTGSRSNVHPSLYGGEATEENGPYDPARDATTLPLIRKAIERGVPLLAICRGIQELNVALGGSLHQHIQNMPDKLDHRMRRDVDFDAKYRPAHPIDITEGGVLHKLLGTRRVLVNSLHAQGIDRLAEGLTVEAVAPDGIVEAVSVTGAKAFALGVQWHPEWPVPYNAVSQALFEAFGAACRARVAARFGTLSAA